MATTCAQFEDALYALRVAFKQSLNNIALTPYERWEMYCDYLDDEEAIWVAHGKPGKRPPNPPAPAA